MLFAFPNQILVERFDFAFIIDIEFEKFPSFYFLCKMIGYDISKCGRHLDNLNNTTKPLIVLSTPTIVQYKPVTI